MLTLDLKTKEGRKKALELIEIADVVVENFSPGFFFFFISKKKKNPPI